MPALSPFRRLFFLLLFLVAGSAGFGQQLQWAKVFPLVKHDQISCVVKDDEFIYAGGYTYRNAFWNGVYYKAILMKLDFNGDTIFTMDLGVSGEVMSMAIDHHGLIRANVRQYYFGPNGYNTFLFQIHPIGLIIKTDTVVGNIPSACMMGKDSSLIIVGYRGRTGFPGQNSMYFWRMDKNGVLDPWVELNPGHPNCVANRVEQLPNGHYLVSGYVGSRIASYELDEWGMNPVFKQWYQTPDFSNLSTGYVSRINGQRYMIGGEGGPSLVGQFDSLSNKYWLRKDIGTQIPPQAMTDGSVVFGYRTGPPLYQTLFRLGPDSSTIWNMALKDSLMARGLPGVVQVKAFSYFEDQSAVLAGTYRWDGVGTTDTKDDPIFLRIANVGTPVTSLSKPKKGPLQNETLAPWPNPSDGTLYLKQHFDKAEIRLYQLSGQEVAQYQIRFGQPIQIHQLPAGLYLYRAVIDGKAFSGKIVKAAH